MKVYTLACIFPGDELPKSVMLAAGSELTVQQDDGYVEFEGLREMIPGRGLIYRHLAAETCMIEFAYMEVRDAVAV